MSTPALNTGNPYAMDDFAFNNTQNAMRANSQNANTANINELELADAAGALESENRLNEENKKEEYLAKHGLDDIDSDLHNLDEFSKFDASKSDKVSANYFEEERKRRKKRQVDGIKKAKRVNGLEDVEDSLLEDFFMFLDSLWNTLTDLADEAFAQINPFTNWGSQKPKNKN